MSPGAQVAAVVHYGMGGGLMAPAVSPGPGKNHRTPHSQPGILGFRTHGMLSG